MTFEFVEKYKECGLSLPERATELSAGYDLSAAQDYTIPPRQDLDCEIFPITYSVNEIADITKQFNMRPTLVSTGVKCKLDEGTYLQLALRSSIPLKTGLVLANGIGIIDADYYNNPSNEGEIFLQILNTTPYHIFIPKGTKIGQGTILPYLTTEDDKASGTRDGGFGSTNHA